MPPIVDLHIHIAARNQAGCKVSTVMERQPAFVFMLLADGVARENLRSDFDGTIRRTIVDALDGAPSVDHGVVLALDSIWSDDGVRHDEPSHLVVTNDYVRGIAASHPKVLFGASVHPNRGAAAGREELERCLFGEPPAALVKWIPNSQLIDAADRRHDWFYETLAESGVPLLCHTGPEHAVPVPPPVAEHQRLGDPRRLGRALEIGVTVIAAHAGARFFPFEVGYLDELAGMMREAESNGRWRLFSDVSAMCLWPRIVTVPRVLGSIPPDRMVLGSDYPIPIADMPPLLVRGLTPAEHGRIRKIRNPIEKNYRQLQAMGFPESIGSRAGELIPERARVWALARSHGVR
ncbi:MAG: amidohydrolase family protein [Thermoanaerobaculaceae bacterium]|jgi:predicted TIM-barrel fold metal-dependent hydrolase